MIGMPALDVGSLNPAEASRAARVWLVWICPHGRMTVEGEFAFWGRPGIDRVMEVSVACRG